MLGASFDSVAKNRAFAEKFAYPFPLLSFDKAADPFGVDDPSDPGWPRRVSFLIAPDGTIAKVFDPVVPAAHPAEVLAHLA